MNKISVVIPVYGCPQALNPLHERLTKTLKQITKSYEIILVNDGCPKGSWDIIKQICKDDKRVLGINLSRNFGQLHSTNAGLNYASGDYVVLMDCDLQDRPESILDLYNEIEKGYDIVFARREDRKDNKLTMFLSKTFYSVYNHLVDGYYDGGIGNFCIVRKRIVEEYNTLKDSNKSFTTILSWMGYKNTIIDLEGDERFEGKSSYSLNRKINLAIDMLTSQSNKPLKMMMYFGFLIALISFVFLTLQVIRRLLYNNITEGWTSVIVAVFLMGGITLICLGVVGIYVGNIFIQTKDTPEYFIQEVLNDKENKK